MFFVDGIQFYYNNFMKEKTLFLKLHIFVVKIRIKIVRHIPRHINYTEERNGR